MAFKVGQKVVCVNDVPKFFNSPGVVYYEETVGMGGLTEGEIYTIDQVGFCPCDKHDVVWIREIVRPSRNPWYLKHYGRPEVCFVAARFRPLQETGMSILKAILANPHKQLETVE